MNMKAEVRQQLLGNMITGRCEQESGICFQPELCSGSKCIRFTTHSTEELLPNLKSKAGAWKTGRLLQYEVYNDGTSLLFQLSLSETGLNQSQKRRMDSFLRAANAVNVPNEKGIIPVRQWKYSIGADIQNAQYVLNEIFEFELPFFEMELRHWLTDHGHTIREFPKLDEAEDLIEGKETSIRTNRFERSVEARKKCIAHYGTACQICGFDFGKVYGPAFAGRIEVHHIVPLNEIREDYVVNPISDLIPVCSNCHTALHSKKDGVYTPEELKAMIYPPVKTSIHK